MDPGAAVAVVALALALVGAALLVDPRAEAAFDAPKRLAALLGIAVAAAAVLVGRRPSAPWSWTGASIEQRLALGAAVVALAGTLASAILSPHRGVALDAGRTLFLFALLLPLGASRVLEQGRAAVLIGAFLVGSAVNAVVSLLQFAGILTLFRVETVGGRRNIDAFVGNDGVLALTLAIAGVICGAFALSSRRPLIRLLATGGIGLYLAGLAITQNLTALLAFGSGCAVLLALLRPRRALAIAALSVLVLAGGAALGRWLGPRAPDVVSAFGANDWDRVLSYRLGPWVAAVEMVRARPLMGSGPGTFAAEFVSHRLQAELRFHRRFVNPFLAGSYAEAHSDYLQAMAEAGLPAGLAAVTALGALMVGLGRVAWRTADEVSRREAIILLAVLSTGATCALTWFPLQRPVTALPLLLVAGRAWRVVGPARKGGGA
jgi:O-antigen ligase